ncbi:hypothetical protein [Mesorhizobium sp. SP-1A]|nr:hypothetical protein [Mesorhizobium sp. SP-1A]
MRPLMITATVLATTLAVFMTGVISYGQYQQAHRIKYIHSQN